jgi:hypothetical protein
MRRDRVTGQVVRKLSGLVRWDYRTDNPFLRGCPVSGVRVQG